MAEFLPNLHDGELWIPSDILVADVPIPAASKTAIPPPPPPPPRPPRPPPPPPFHFRRSRDFSVDGDLARHLGALSLLNRPYLSSSQLQRFGPANKYALTASPPLTTPTGPPSAHPTAVFGFRSGSVYSTLDPVLHYHFVQPGQADGLTTETRVAAHLQASQTRLLYQSAVSRPLQPGFVRDSGGTGVFLPRAAGDAGRRKQGLRNRDMASMMSENQRIGQGRRIGAGNPAEEWWLNNGHGAVAPANTALPRDWTN